MIRIHRDFPTLWLTLPRYASPQRKCHTSHSLRQATAIDLNDCAGQVNKKLKRQQKEIKKAHQELEIAFPIHQNHPL